MSSTSSPQRDWRDILKQFRPLRVNEPYNRKLPYPDLNPESKVPCQYTFGVRNEFFFALRRDELQKHLQAAGIDPVGSLDDDKFYRQSRIIASRWLVYQLDRWQIEYWNGVLNGPVVNNVDPRSATDRSSWGLSTPKEVQDNVPWTQMRTHIGRDKLRGYDGANHWFVFALTLQSPPVPFSERGRLLPQLAYIEAVLRSAGGPFPHERHDHPWLPVCASFSTHRCCLRVQLGVERIEGPDGKKIRIPFGVVQHLLVLWNAWRDQLETIQPHTTRQLLWCRRLDQVYNISQEDLPRVFYNATKIDDIQNVNVKDYSYDPPIIRLPKEIQKSFRFSRLNIVGLDKRNFGSAWSAGKKVVTSRSDEEPFVIEFREHAGSLDALTIFYWLIVVQFAVAKCHNLFAGDNLNPYDRLPLPAECSRVHGPEPDDNFYHFLQTIQLLGRENGDVNVGPLIEHFRARVTRFEELTPRHDHPYVARATTFNDVITNIDPGRDHRIQVPGDPRRSATWGRFHVRKVERQEGTDEVIVRSRFDAKARTLSNVLKHVVGKGPRKRSSGFDKDRAPDKHWKTQDGGSALDLKGLVLWEAPETKGKEGVRPYLSVRAERKRAGAVIDGTARIMKKRKTGVEKVTVIGVKA
ncbi:MAG: hypothetical protein M1814_003547 [Vezdaea aestivalis]|nr:MAG: hypothetical protein M1814_003547 [Vezdaea aestivalis]